MTETSAETIERMREISFVPVLGTPEDMGAFFDKDWEANALVIREAKVTLS